MICEGQSRLVKSHLEIGNEPSSGRVEAQAELPSLLVSHSPPPLGEGPSKDIFYVLAKGSHPLRKVQFF